MTCCDSHPSLAIINPIQTHTAQHLLTIRINRRFSNDESFLKDPNAFNDTANSTADVPGITDALERKSSGSRL